AVDLLFVAGHLDDQRFRAGIDDVSAEDVAELDRLAARVRVNAHLDQRQVAADTRHLADVLNLDHVHQLVQVLRNLIRSGIDHNCHAREVNGVRAPDCQAVDVEVPTSEQARHPVQHTGFVLDQRHERLFARHNSVPHFPSIGRRIMLCRSAPAGTIGYTMSCFSTTKSISTGPSLTLAAHSIAGITSWREVTRRAGMPYASASFTKSGLCIGVAL